jgi:AraC family transcriptional activator of pobA
MTQPIPTYNFNLLPGKDLFASVFQWDNVQPYDSEKEHAHGYHEFLIFQKGGGTHQMGYQGLDNNSGAVHVLPAGYTHQMRRANDSKGFTIAVSNLFLVQLQQFHKEDSLFELIRKPQSLEHSAAQFKEFDFYFDQLAQEGLDLSIKHNIIAIVLLKFAQQANFSATDHPESLFAIQLIDLLNANYREKPSTEFYAEHLNLSKSTFTKKVKLAFGKTVMDLQNDRILEEAKGMLLMGDETISQVAERLSFTDESHFSHFFKNHTGISPSAFRKS